MNICGGGVCVCQGGSDVIGEDSSCDASRRPFFSGGPTYRRRLYYFDDAYGVVFSVDDPTPHQMSVHEFYEDSALTIRAL